MVKEQNKEINAKEIDLSPQAIEKRHQEQFLEAYNKLVQEYGYMLQPVLTLQIIKIQKPEEEKKEAK